MAALHLASPPGSICILRLSAIGDITHVLPIIATLREVWPDTRITWIIGAVEYQLVKSLQQVEFIVFDKQAGVGEWFRLYAKLRARRFDLLLLMQVALRASLLSLLVRADLRIGYDRQRSRDLHGLFCDQRIEGPHRVHVLDGFFQFLEKLGITRRRMDWLLQADAPDKEFAARIIAQRPTVIINPCSSPRRNNWRNWAIENYAAVIDYLLDRDIQVILTGGPSALEKEFARAIVRSCRRTPVDMVGQTSLTQLLALMHQARCLIAPDTGPAHMGTVAGIPVIGLFASSNPLRTGPYLSQAILVSRYREALRQYLNTSEEQARWGKRVRDPDVMNLIERESVIERLQSCLNLQPAVGEKITGCSE
jgi:heptosyltransferase I